jgi:hypothetical protein
MQSALILMTILGCDDTATQCHYVEMLDERWTNIQSCDADAEQQLAGYANIPYPVVVAVCQSPEDSGLAEVAGDAVDEINADDGDDAIAQLKSNGGPEASAGLPAGAPVPPAEIPEASSSLAAGFAEEAETPTTEADDAGIAERVLARVKGALPEPENIKTLLTKPVHVVTERYSWVAKRFDK